MLNIKFKESVLSKLAAFLSFFCSFISLGTIVFLKYVGIHIGIYALVYYFVYIFLIVLFLVLGIYYLNFAKIDYLKVSDTMISIKTNFFTKRKNIEFSDIAEVTRISNRLVLTLTGSKKYEIKLDLLEGRDIELLIKLLSEKM